MDRFDLGNHTRQVSTTSVDAQRWFDRGLNWCFAFNKTEGAKCFTKALEYDPDCVMAHWGVAYASGPYYNLTWRDFGEVEATAATSTAFAHIQKGREKSYTARLLPTFLAPRLVDVRVKFNAVGWQMFVFRKSGITGLIHP